jgi:hypothetical protein
MKTMLNINRLSILEWLLSPWSHFDGETVILSQFFASGMTNSTCFGCAAGETHDHLIIVDTKYFF